MPNERGDDGIGKNELPKEQSLQLKFLAQVCDPVRSGNELKGKNVEFLELALIDASENIVTCVPESSADVEIVLLDASCNDDKNNMTCENFERRIITPGDNQKPRFAKSAKCVAINLKNGVGKLSGLKLGHGTKWTKSCICRLGARIAQTLGGTTVQEAWTEQFKVIDKRTKDSDKHHPPNLSSEVWRLDKIAKKGAPCKRLEDNDIKTLKEFMFWFNVDREGLRQILHVVESIWNTIVGHAKECTIDDNMTYSKSSTEPQMHVIYDAVGNLKGVVIESRFVPSDELSGDEKDSAYKLLSSLLKRPAFGERYKNVVLPQELPYRSSDIYTSTMQQCPNPNGSGLALAPENISGQCGSQSQSIDLSGLFDSLGSEEMGELYNATSGPFPEPEFTDGGTPTDLDYGMLETHSLFEELSRLVNIPRDGEIHTSCHSVRSTMEFQNELYPSPPSPNLMFNCTFTDDSVSHLGDDCYNGIGEGMEWPLPHFDSFPKTKDYKKH